MYSSTSRSTNICTWRLLKSLWYNFYIFCERTKVFIIKVFFFLFFLSCIAAVLLPLLLLLLLPLLLLFLFFQSEVRSDSLLLGKRRQKIYNYFFIFVRLFADSWGFNIIVKCKLKAFFRQLRKNCFFYEFLKNLFLLVWLTHLMAVLILASSPEPVA